MLYSSRIYIKKRVKLTLFCAHNYGINSYIPAATRNHRRCIFSETQNNGSSSSPKTFTKVLTVIAVSVIFALGGYIFRPKNRSKKCVGTELFKDPFCKGTSSTMVKYGQFWLPFEFFKEEKKLEQLKQFTIQEDDVLVASFPKSGTTWVQEIVYLTLNGLEVSQTETIEERFPYLEYVYPGLEALARAKTPRCMKTHLPLDCLPRQLLQGNGKVIYIARNPKDVAVSYYHFIRMLTVIKYSGQFSDLFRSFIEGKVSYGPWVKHVVQYWVKANADNILFVTYEDLHQDPVSTIQRIASFLGRDVSVDQAKLIAVRCSFRNMKANKMSNYTWWDELGLRDKKCSQFMRKGKVGDWKNYFTDEMSREFEEIFLEPLKDQGLHFVDEL